MTLSFVNIQLCNKLQRSEVSISQSALPLRRARSASDLLNCSSHFRVVSHGCTILRKMMAEATSRSMPQGQGPSSLCTVPFPFHVATITEPRRGRRCDVQYKPLRGAIEAVVAAMTAATGD